MDGSVLAGATVRLKVNGYDEMATIEGHGPVEVLDRALRTALKKFYPVLSLTCIYPIIKSVFWTRKRAQGPRCVY